MFEQPFEQLFHAVNRIEQQLEKATDEAQKQMLAEELMTLRNTCDQFVGQWLAFEERVAGIDEKFGLKLDGGLPFQEIHGLQESWSELTAKNQGNSQLTGQTLTLADVPAQEIVAYPEISFPKPHEEQMIRSFRRGMGFFDLFMFGEAIEEFEEVVRLDSDFVIARLYLALGYLGKNDYENATRHLRLLALSETDPFIRATVHHSFGYMYASQEQYHDAAKEFIQVIEYMPNFHDAFFNLGICYYNLGKYVEALHAFEQAIDEEDWEAQRMIGYTWIRLGSLIKALPHFENAYLLNSLNEHLLLELADLYQSLGRVQTAKSLLKKASEFFPRTPEVMGGLGWLAMREGRFHEAILLFKKQLSLSPRNIQGILNLGWAYVKAQDFVNAKRCYLEILRIEPGNPYAIAAFARLLYLSGKETDAKEWLAELSKQNSNVAKRLGYFHLGRICLEKEQYDQAICYFTSALQYDQECVETHFYKGLAHHALGEKLEAERCFENCRSIVSSPWS